MLADLLVVQPGGVLDEPGGEVVRGFAAAALDEPGQRVEHIGVARDRGRRAPRHVAGGLDHPVVVLLGHADDRARHHHRQPLGELADQVGTALLAELVDEPVAVAVDVAADPAGVDAGHAVGDRAAQALVGGAVGEHTHRLPGEDRGQRVVRGDAAVLEGPPPAGVAGELRGRTGHVQVLAVSEDQPGGHVPVEQHGGHAAVFGAQLVVEAVGVPFGLRAVEPAQSAGADAEAVGRAFGGRDRPRGRSGLVVEWGCHDRSRDQVSKNRTGGDARGGMGTAVRRAGGTGCADSASGSSAHRGWSRAVARRSRSSGPLRAGPGHSAAPRRGVSGRRGRC